MDLPAKLSILIGSDCVRVYGGRDPSAGEKDSAYRAASDMLSDRTGSTSYSPAKGYHDSAHPNIWLYHEATDQARGRKL